MLTPFLPPSSLAPPHHRANMRLCGFENAGNVAFSWMTPNRGAEGGGASADKVPRLAYSYRDELQWNLDFEGTKAGRSRVVGRAGCHVGWWWCRWMGTHSSSLPWHRMACERMAGVQAR